MFRNQEITPDVLLASACLPTMFQAIEIDGEPYWDGGFVGNPTITPLVRESDAHDTILIQINPARTARHATHRERDPEPPQRDFVQLAADEGTAHDRASAPGRSIRASGEGARWARHAHAPDHDRQARRVRRILEAQRQNWRFLTILKEEGRRSAEAFLAEHGEDVGKRSTTDLDALLAEC